MTTMAHVTRIKGEGWQRHTCGHSLFLPHTLSHAIVSFSSLNTQAWTQTHPVFREVKVSFRNKSDDITNIAPQSRT